MKSEKPGVMLPIEAVRPASTRGAQPETIAQISRRVTGPLVGVKGRPAKGSLDTQNSYELVF
jgi:hypothetical protein